MSLSSQQRGVAVGAAAAALLTLVSLSVAALLGAGDTIALEARLDLLAMSLLAPAATLVICVGRVANHRFDSPEDIDGSGITVGSTRVKLLQAILQNTLEQAVLAALVYVACTLLGSTRLLSMVPVAAALFVVGRMTFFWGYARGAPGRALGFGLTFYPTSVLLVCALVAGARQVGS